MATFKKVDYLIIGAGPSGLACAYCLQGNSLILEKESEVGGLCRSVYHRGGVFDIGGHSFHTPYPEVYKIVEQLLEPDGGLEGQERNAWVDFKGKLIPYPFQKHFDQIDDLNIVKACANGLQNKPGDAEHSKNYEEYLIRNFGKGIANNFMLPYNRKLWGCDLSLMSANWAPERVSAPKGDYQSFQTEGGNRKPLQADTIVSYPRHGGFNRIFEAFARQVQSIELNTNVVKIDPNLKRVRTSNNEEIEYKKLISTIPLPSLLSLFTHPNIKMQKLAGKLEFLSLRVELFLIGKKLKTKVQRIYNADSAVPSHKMAFNHNSSQTLRDANVHAIMSEISYSTSKKIKTDEVTGKQIDYFTHMGFIDGEKDIVWKDHLEIKYGYPIYIHNRADIVKKIKSYLVKSNIHSIGRFGEWEYINSDKCIMKGLELALRLKGNLMI